MDDKYLLERGYKQYPVTQFDSDLVVARFQKRFDDEVGKKYFINVIKNSWESIEHHYIKDKWYTRFTYTYEVQITMFDDEKPINLEFFSCWQLEEVETYMEKLFKEMNVNHYHKWNEE